MTYYRKQSKWVKRVIQKTRTTIKQPSCMTGMCDAWVGQLYITAEQCHSLRRNIYCATIFRVLNIQSYFTFLINYLDEPCPTSPRVSLPQLHTPHTNKPFNNNKERGFVKPSPSSSPSPRQQVSLSSSPPQPVAREQQPAVHQPFSPPLP